MTHYAVVLSFWLTAIDNPDANVHLVLIAIVVFLGLTLYFMPWLIANHRHHHNQVPIFLVNLFFGWTAIGWIASLIWAFTSPAPNQAAIVQQVSPPPDGIGSGRSRIAKVGLASLTVLIAVAALIVFSPKNESSEHVALTSPALTGSEHAASTPPEITGKTQPTKVEVPVLNEQGMEFVMYSLLDDMETSVRGRGALLKPEEMLRLTGIDLKTTAEQYYADYDANEVAADQKYRGKKILLTGVIESINKDFMGDAYLVLKASNPFFGVHAELNERGMAGASALAKDTTIYLVCDSGTRIIGSAVARNCQQFSQYLDQIRPSLKLAIEKQLREQSSTPTELVQVLRVMYLVGTQLPPDSPCFTRTDDACKALVAAIEEDKAKMQVLAEQFKRTFPAGASSNSVQQANPGSKTYTNSRYGFQVVYPESFVPQQPPENGDGLTFNSQDGKALLVVSGGNNPGFTVEDEFYKAIKNIHGQLGYKEAGRSWFAVSWTDGDNIGYTKEFVGLRSLNTFTITFPVERKAEYNSIVTNIEKAFRPGDLDNSH